MRAQPEANHLVFRFDSVEVRESDFLITRAGSRLSVEPKALKVLLYLLHNPGRLVRKVELLDAVWGDVAVTENSLTRAIALLRHLLDDDPHRPRFIETVATAGYRFVYPVEVFKDDANGGQDRGNRTIDPLTEGTEVVAQPQETEGETPGKTISAKLPVRKVRALGGRRLLVGAALAAGVATAAWYLHRPLPPPRITGYVKLTHDGHAKFLGGTDGSRIFFTQGSPISIREIAITGGESAPVQAAASLGEVYLWDVSADGSNFLVAQTQIGEQPFDLWNVRALGGSLRRLKPALSAVFSPDGSSIVYSTVDNELRTIRSDGTGDHKLIATGDKVFFVAWSPDDTIQFFKRSSIWEISADGSNLHQLIPNWNPPSFSCCGYWTPDGHFFLFEAGDIARGFQIWAIDRRRGLLRKPPEKPIQLTSGPINWDWPIPSRNGKTIFAGGRALLGELSRFDVRSKQLQPYLGGISAEFVSYSHDDKSVAYVTFPDGILWRANRDGTHPVQLTDPPLYALNPRWSPNDAEILFSAWGTKGFGLSYVVSSEGGTPSRLLPENSEPDGDPTWSPDGRRIAFSVGRPWDRKNHHVNILDRHNGEIMIVPGSEGLWSARWSPDGRYIAALSYDAPVLRVFDFKTQRWTGMPLEGDVNFPAWSHDSGSIYGLVFNFTGKERWVFRVSVTGNKPEFLLDLKDLHLTGWCGFSLTLDPTDAPLLLREIGSNEIYALTLETK